MSLNGPNMYPMAGGQFIGTARNRERTGARHVTRLSKIARGIDKVRHVDVDLVQYCPRCKRPQIFAEVKRFLVSDWEWEQARNYAQFYGHNCIAILVVETLDDIGVKVYDDEGISDITWGGEEYLVKILEGARDAHSCW